MEPPKNVLRDVETKKRVIRSTQLKKRFGRRSENSFLDSIHLGQHFCGFRKTPIFYTGECARRKTKALLLQFCYPKER